MSDNGPQGNKRGFWGTTLTKLKSVLAKTKEQVQDAEAELNDEATAGTSQPVQATQNTQTAPQPAPQPVAVAQIAKPDSWHKSVDQDYIENLEERLIRADLGLATVTPIIQKLEQESKGKNWTGKDVDAFLKRQFSELLASAPSSTLGYKAGQVNVYLIVGVNGVGKTTSIGKLASRFKSEGKRVLLAAGDTFRAAAESQLEIWSNRAGVDIVRLAEGADPGAVVFQAVKKARDENYDVLLIDTAGRLHNKTNLMDELKKVRGVIEKHARDLPLESLLVLDASTGQNGLQQAKVFCEVAGLTGVVLTKLDGTAKGGVVFAIARELKIPVKLIGIGEKMEDLRDFEPGLFVEALF
ncbi:MAG: signal recognition particle-docking protein FtsY [Candidatus Obscuribacter sp.]|nr:signal recognition particle-docking protein FtsY [Candidatus Obscuribacter sp.]